MELPRELAKHNLSRPQIPKNRRLILMVSGATGTGKTDLMLRSAPRPLLVINIDRNLEPLEAKYADDTDLFYKDIHLPRRIDQEADKKVWDDVRELYQTSVEKKIFRSVLLDTGDAMYELVRRAKLGTLDFGEVPRSMYSIVNSNMKWFYSLAKDNKINLCVTHRLTPRYKTTTNPKTGREMSVETQEMKAAGWKESEYEAQMHVVLSKEPKITGPERYKALIAKCTADPEKEYEELVGEDITFANLGMMACPWSKRGDWE